MMLNALPKVPAGQLHKGRSCLIRALVSLVTSREVTGWMGRTYGVGPVMFCQSSRCCLNGNSPVLSSLGSLRPPSPARPAQVMGNYPAFFRGFCGGQCSPWMYRKDKLSKQDTDVCCTCFIEHSLLHTLNCKNLSSYITGRKGGHDTTV